MRRFIQSTIALVLTFVMLVVSFTPVSQVEAQAGVAAVCGATYTVQLGNTLTGIARSCGVNYASLRAANPGIINPNLIFPGQVINVPAGGTIPNTGGQGTYIVQPGDTLSRIALARNTTVAAIAAVNPGITNVNLIFPGQVINIPAATGGTVPNPTPAPTIAPTPVPTTGGGTIPNTGGRLNYTVVSGDTLWSISNRYGTTVVDIWAINPQLNRGTLIYPGQVIAIP